MKTILKIILAVFIVVVSIFIMAYTEQGIVLLVIPKDTLFFESYRIVQVIKMHFIMGSLLLLYNKKVREILFTKKYLSLAIILWLSIIHMLSFTFASVQQDTITFHTFYNPYGNTKSLSEIQFVETKFLHHESLQYPMAKKGDFYYEVNFENHKFTFLQPNAIKEKYDNYDTYLELEQFDKKLMELNIIKQSDADYFDSNTLDETYRQRFLRIVNNK